MIRLSDNESGGGPYSDRQLPVALYTTSARFKDIYVDGNHDLEEPFEVDELPEDVTNETLMEEESLRYIT